VKRGRPKSLGMRWCKRIGYKKREVCAMCINDAQDKNKWTGGDDAAEE